MYWFECVFLKADTTDDNEAKQAIVRLLSTMTMNGQLLGKEQVVFAGEASYRAFLHSPEPDSLDRGYSDYYVGEALQKLEELNIKFHIDLKGESISSERVCYCDQTESYVLFTHHVSDAPPLRFVINSSKIQYVKNI